jgi:hypothetical protein
MKPKNFTQTTFNEVSLIRFAYLARYRQTQSGWSGPLFSRVAKSINKGQNRKIQALSNFIKTAILEIFEYPLVFSKLKSQCVDHILAINQTVVRRLRPFLRRALITFLPPTDFMRLRKPCFLVARALCG